MNKYLSFLTALFATTLFTIIMGLTKQPALPPYIFVILNTQLYIVLLLWNLSDKTTNND
jgi:hypothetical protein